MKNNNDIFIVYLQVLDDGDGFSLREPRAILMVRRRDKALSIRLLHLKVLWILVQCFQTLI